MGNDGAFLVTEDSGPGSFGPLAVVDALKVRRLSPETYCGCHWMALTHANANLLPLSLLAGTGPTRLLNYFAAATVRAIGDMRVYPCPCCWFKALREQVAKARTAPFVLRGQRFETALDATEALWWSVYDGLRTIFTPTAFLRVAAVDFRRGAEQTGLKLRADGGPVSSDPPVPGESAALFVSHTLGLLSSVWHTFGSSLDDLHRVCEAKIGRGDRAGVGADADELLEELLRFPGDEARRLVQDLLADTDLNVLAEEVETEFGRAVCSLCFSPKPRNKPKSGVHDRWVAQHDKGLTYGQIANIHSKQTGRPVTRDAVAKAVKRRKR